MNYLRYIRARYFWIRHFQQRAAMANLILRPAWQGRESDVTPQGVYRDRRRFIKEMALGAVAVGALGSSGCADREVARRVEAARPDDPWATVPANAPRDGFPAARNATYQVPERPLTDRELPVTYNNYYEFNPPPGEKDVWQLTGAYEPFPHTIEFKGLVERPFRVDLEELIREMELEERVYRFRCVEAWSMTVPWTGFPLRKLIEYGKPLSSATHVRFVSRSEPQVMPGVVEAEYYPWPYYEGLRLDEATNDLAFVAIGIYGEPLPKQNGSPLRLALPWKYGYKGPKGIVTVEFTDTQPPTFWNDLQPLEYGFLSNVNPNVPHPRWSQATEELLGTDGRIPTQLLNGYAEFVGSLYPDEPTSLTRVVR